MRSGLEISQMRKMASVRRITEINPIAGADAIACAVVDAGWPVVVKKGDFAVGELAIFFEIDSWVPHSLAPFLAKSSGPRMYNGIQGERLRTVKLRGQISQGLLLPLLVAPGNWSEGDDLTEVLGVQKWEPSIPAQLAGVMRGNFPPFLRKTDQERVQNLAGKINWDDEYEVSIKLDGSSMTIWRNGADWGVCSRNVDLKLDQAGNAFVDTALKITSCGFGDWPENIAIQGELMGPGIQGNRENLTECKFFAFNAWDIADQKYWPPVLARRLCTRLGINYVPVLHDSVRLVDIGINSVQTALTAAEGPSMHAQTREGLVFKRTDGSDSFKAISNAFLLREK